MVKKLIIAIHDLHPWGGQDKSNLEILYPVNKDVPMELHAYQFIDQRPWPQLKFIPYSVKFTKIFLVKQFHYIFMTTLHFIWRYRKSIRRKNQIWIQTTGTASLIADIIQVQFIHSSWQKIIDNFEVKSTISGWKAIYQGLISSWNAALEQLVFTPNRKYIAISHAIKKELISEFSIPEKNIITIYHGVDTEEFCPHSSTSTSTSTRQRLRKELGVNDDDYVLLHVGALNERKGVNTAISTLGYLHKNGIENVHYVAIGSGDRQILSELAEAEGVKSKVHFISHSKNVRDYYWASDIFFFPTVYEPFGLVVLEAMASGLCTVVSSTAGASELVTHKTNGLLIKNIFDPTTMGDQLTSLIKDKALQEKLSTEARALALKNSWQHVADNYLAFYKTLKRDDSRGGP
ncbi:MAG: glycosyltransferase family 4 protein [Bdellovibrionales bacterium]|nr:glycosyltransferase family 4 protein [Bdellovibrionales bacterium]